ncbi:MAG: FHA domain-containing protein [Deltaproteobacteria bacterium]|nr:FHA domain-containing protein [Deltaproteobacteria bacterium]
MGGRLPRVFHLRGQDLVVGRDDGVDVMVDEVSVSGRHGVLKATPAGYTYEDLESRNGSVLVRDGGAPTPLVAGEPVFVHAGDALLLGDARRPVRLTVRAASAVHAEPQGAHPQRTVVATAPLADLLGAATRASWRSPRRRSPRRTPPRSPAPRTPSSVTFSQPRPGGASPYGAPASTRRSATTCRGVSAPPRSTGPRSCSSPKGTPPSR